MLAKSMYHHCLRFDCLENCCPNYSVFPDTLCGISLWIVPCFFDLISHQPPHRLLGCYAIKYGSRGYGHSGISSLGLTCDAKDLEWQWYICLNLLETRPKIFFLRFFYSNLKMVAKCWHFCNAFLNFELKNFKKRPLISLRHNPHPYFVLSSETHAPRTTVADTASIKAPPGQGCPRCGGAVFAAEQMLSKGREWHRKCFKCKDCNKTLDSIIACDGPDKDVYCRTCYGKKWGPHGYGFACGSGFLQTDAQRYFF